YRVSSKQGTLFRMWATDKLVQFAIKGFVIDAERLKNPAEHDRFAELRRIIQDIRASEANVYAELRRILAMCSDYDHKSGGDFFATFQNKLHFAVTGMTAAEILLDRADASKPNMALTNWPKDEIRKQDVTIAKNYLYEVDMSGLNRVTSMLLDYFEDQVERQRLVSTAAAENWLDKWLLANDRAILPNKGRVAAKDAKDHAHRQYAVFDERRRANRKQQADAELAALRTEVKKLPKPHKKDRP
ncbi:MAG: RhuM family protein, partial [Hyphomicrobiaceae bacterium]